MVRLVEMLKAIESLVTIVAIIVGGAWAYWKFVKRREDFPHVEFTVDINFVGIQKDHWLVEVLAFLENKGLVPHLIKVFQFDLRYMSEDDDVKDGDETINNQTYVPRELKEGSWIPKDWGDTFIDPGLRTKYSYITKIPRQASFVLLHGKFKYEDGRYFHTADKLIRVPKEEAAKTEARPA